jgi:hypothetical protein
VAPGLALRRAGPGLDVGGGVGDGLREPEGPVRVPVALDLLEPGRGLSFSVQLVSVSIRNAASRCTNAVAPGRTWLIRPPQANRVIPAPPALLLPGQRCTHRIAVSTPAAGSARRRNRDRDANRPDGTLWARNFWAAT